jgi:hypothetical protein
MAEQITYYPYCVVGDQARLMLPRPGGWFICPQWSHTAMPGKPEFRCFCQKCGELKRAA